jgi:hypothetical protein
MSTSISRSRPRSRSASPTRPHANKHSHRSSRSRSRSLARNETSIQSASVECAPTSTPVQSTPIQDSKRDEASLGDSKTTLINIVSHRVHSHPRNDSILDSSHKFKLHAGRIDSSLHKQGRKAFKAKRALWWRCLELEHKRQKEIDASSLLISGHRPVVIRRALIPDTTVFDAPVLELPCKRIKTRDGRSEPASVSAVSPSTTIPFSTTRTESEAKTHAKSTLNASDGEEQVSRIALLVFHWEKTFRAPIRIRSYCDLTPRQWQICLFRLQSETGCMNGHCILPMSTVSKLLHPLQFIDPPRLGARLPLDDEEINESDARERHLRTLDIVEGVCRYHGIKHPDFRPPNTLESHRAASASEWFLKQVFHAC